MRMRKLLGTALFLAAVSGALALSWSPAAQASGCSCPKTTPVCCLNCDGTFAYCARSHAFCPECAAP